MQSPTTTPRPDGADRGRVRLSLVTGLGGLRLVALIGSAGGPVIVLALMAICMFLTALWTLVRGRSWVGAIGMGGEVALLAVSVVSLAAAGAIAGPIDVGVDPAGASSSMVAAPAASPRSAPELSPTPAAVVSTPTAAPETTPPRSALPDAGPVTALEIAMTLEVKGRAPRTGYDRDLFGSGWVDVDRNGCDTRNDILARDLTGVTFKPGTRDCVVLSGTLADPYSGRTIGFLRGNDTSNDVQIDHVVALSDAWQKGAQAWDETTRVAFANDPLNLLAADGPLNQAKGDGDTATWLPPNRAYRCAHVARQVAVKHTYGLWVTQAPSRTPWSGCFRRVRTRTCPRIPRPRAVPHFSFRGEVLMGSGAPC